MIYFDNAATTMVKPPEVSQVLIEALQTFGGVGRGVHGASLSAGMSAFECRDALARLLGAPNASRVSFASNATEALNIAIFGLLAPGQHAVTTAAAHNSVLRPLYLKRDQQNCSLSIAPIGSDGSLDADTFRACFRENTRLAVLPHASNLTGDVYNLDELAAIAHEYGALVVVDAAQTAGVIPLDMAASNLDVVCFTGHKSLFGPQGTGGLAVAEGVEIPPLKVGGSGFHSYDEQHPSRMPESLEAGTLNSHGIAGLAAGVRYVAERGLDDIHAYEMGLANRFCSGVKDLRGVRILGGGAFDRTAVVALNVGDIDSGMIADRLSCDWGICTRAGAHCAPLMHKALGTEGQGAVRFSFSVFNTPEEVDVAVEAMATIVAEAFGN